MRARNACRSSGFARAASKARAARCSGVARSAAALLAAVWAQILGDQSKRRATPNLKVQPRAETLSLGIGLSPANAHEESSIRVRANVRLNHERLCRQQFPLLRAQAYRPRTFRQPYF